MSIIPNFPNLIFLINFPNLQIHFKLRIKALNFGPLMFFELEIQNLKNIFCKFQIQTLKVFVWIMVVKCGLSNIFIRSGDEKWGP